MIPKARQHFFIAGRLLINPITPQPAVNNACQLSCYNSSMCAQVWNTNHYISKL